MFGGGSEPASVEGGRETVASKWSAVRGAKVPAGMEAMAVESGRALRDAIALQELRKSRGVTQVGLATTLGRSQASISELERRDDVYLSSLREYVRALGGELEVAAIFDDERMPIAIG